MPEPQETTETAVEETKSINILDFFKTPIKENKKEKLKPLTKIVIRRLPPRLTKEDFHKEFILPPNDYFYFVRGDLSLGIHSFSRAYVNFSNLEDIYGFKEKYDDHPIRDELGKEYHTVVEWAPIQRVPKRNSQKKKPIKLGPLESDPKYTEFLSKLEELKNAPASASEYFMETDNTTSKEAKVTTTPLLEFIKMKRQKKMDMKTDNRLKKREAEKERRRREDELRKTEKIKKMKEEKGKKTEASDEKTDVSHAKEKDIRVKKNEATTVRDEIRETKDIKVKKIVEKCSKHEKREGKINRKEDKLEKKDRALAKSSIESTPQKPEKAHASQESTTAPVSKRENADDKSKSIQSSRQPPSDTRTTDASRSTGLKSKFRYSEQRTREWEIRNQKQGTTSEKIETNDEKSVEEPFVEEQSNKTDEEQLKSQDSLDGASDGDDPGTNDTDEKPRSGGRRDPRTERRIRNKDRPTMEIYRPGMGKFSKQRMEQKKDETGCSSKDSGTTSEADEVVEKLETLVKSLTFSRSLSK